MSEYLFPRMRAITLADIPEAERPNARLERLGAAALSNEELVAVLLGPGATVLDQARELLAQFQGLAALGGIDSLGWRASGLTNGQAAKLAAAFEVARRMPAEGLAMRDLLNEPRLVKEFLRNSSADESQERTGALFLNARNRLLRHDPQIYLGTLDRAVVEPREILRRALLCRAAGIILHHNHPSGDPTPSREDREFTRRLGTACESVGVRLLDHVVVGREGCVSFREAGLM